MGSNVVRSPIGLGGQNTRVVFEWCERTNDQSYGHYGCDAETLRQHNGVQAFALLGPAIKSFARDMLEFGLKPGDQLQAYCGDVHSIQSFELLTLLAVVYCPTSERFVFDGSVAALGRARGSLSYVSCVLSYLSIKLDRHYMCSVRVLKSYSLLLCCWLMFAMFV